MVLSFLYKYFNRVKNISLPEAGITFVSAVILVAVMSLSIWASLVLSDVILKARSARVTEDEMAVIANGLLNFYRDCDQFPTDTGDVAVDFLDFETQPATSRFEGNAALQSYRASVWDGPYVKGGYDEDKDGDTVDYIDDYLRDGWNNPYIYDYTASASSATITSYGLNRVTGGGDDIVVTVVADGVVEDKIRKTKEELSYINAKKDELESRYSTAGESWPPGGFDIDSLFLTYGADTTGLVGWWKMDEASWNGTANEVVDSSGEGNHGTASGATTSICGKIGRCGYFDGNDYIDLPNDLGYSSQDLSVFVWFKHNGTPPGNYHIIMGGQELEISINVGDYLRTGLYTSSRYVSNHGTGLLDKDWHFIGFVYDADSATKTSYIDSTYVGEQTPIAGTLTTSFSYRRLGRFGSSATYYLNGFLDEVRIWSRALTESDILQEFLRGTYLTDWSYRYDEWQNLYMWDGSDNVFYSYGPDRAAGGDDDIYQSE